MKKNQFVKVIDGSYSLKLERGQFSRSYGIDLAGRKFQIVDLKLKLPAENSTAKQLGTKWEYNDTILRDVQNNEIVFIQERFLVPYDVCPYCGK